MIRTEQAVCLFYRLWVQFCTIAYIYSIGTSLAIFINSRYEHKTNKINCQFDAEKET